MRWFARAVAGGIPPALRLGRRRLYQPSIQSITAVLAASLLAKVRWCISVFAAQIFLFDRVAPGPRLFDQVHHGHAHRPARSWGCVPEEGSLPE